MFIIFLYSVIHTLAPDCLCPEESIHGSKTLEINVLKTVLKVIVLFLPI